MDLSKPGYQQFHEKIAKQAIPKCIFQNQKQVFSNFTKKLQKQAKMYMLFKIKQGFSEFHEKMQNMPAFIKKKNHS